MKTYEHYGIEVKKQYVDRPFLVLLREKGIEYTELPIVEHHVAVYECDGNKRYALMIPQSEYEAVYLTEEIPMDLSWDALRYDVDAQYEGEAPRQMPTRLKVLIETALDRAYKILGAAGEQDVFAKDFSLPSEDDLYPLVRTELVRAGFDLQNLDIVDSHDVDPDFLAKIK